MTVLGNALVLLALLAAVGAALSFVRAGSRGGSAPTLPWFLARAHLFFVVLASSLLLALILLHDFSIGYVFGYSDRSLPLAYLVSTFYAGQEGSFLFWALCGAVIALILGRYSSRRQIGPHVMAVFMGIQAVLLLLILVKSPFNSVWSVYPQLEAGRVPADGRGLNPLLQNFWMVIHPPVLFVGFAAMAAPFAVAIGGLWKREYDILTSHALPWVLFAVTALGLGIMLGAYWAYGVLGWGGYWGWDPVENSSLVPWLTGMALLHTLLAQLRTGKFVRTNFALALISFVLVIYSTFLTRSGVLGDASVHSFTDPGSVVYWVLLFFLFGVTALGTGFFLKHWSAMRATGEGSGVLTREFALGGGTLLLVLSAAVVLFGTSLPIFSSLRAETSFYDTTHIPVAIALGLLIGLSLYTQWEVQDPRETARRSWKMAILALLVCAVLFFFGVREPVVLLFVLASVFAIAANLDIAVRVAKGDWRFLGGKIAHIGIGVFLLGVISTGKFTETRQLALSRGTPEVALGYSLTYVGSRQLPDGKYAFDVRFEDKERSFVLSPVMFEAGAQGIMKNPDIETFATKDIYLSPLGLEQDRGSSGEATMLTLQKGESRDLLQARVTFDGFDMGGHASQFAGEGMAVGAALTIRAGKAEEKITPVTFYRTGGDPDPRAVPSKVLGGTVELVTVSVGTDESPSRITLRFREGGGTTPPADLLIVDASVKPYMNLVWAGTVLMIAGFVLSIFKRSKES